MPDISIGGQVIAVYMDEWERVSRAFTTALHTERHPLHMRRGNMVGVRNRIGQRKGRGQHQNVVVLLTTLPRSGAGPVPPSGRCGFLHQPVSCTNHVISTHVFLFPICWFLGLSWGLSHAPGFHTCFLYLGCRDPAIGGKQNQSNI